MTAAAAAWQYLGKACAPPDPGPMQTTEEQIRAAAEATLKRWPAASAVLLFGSRARGDHLPSSDWDLAVVTDDPRGYPLDLPLFRLDPQEIDLAFISDADIRRHRNRLGRLGCELARDARPIAGNWRPPAGLKEPEMDHETYWEEISNSLSRLRRSPAFGIARLPQFVGSGRTAGREQVREQVRRCSGALGQGNAGPERPPAAGDSPPQPACGRYSGAGSKAGGRGAEPERPYQSRSRRARRQFTTRHSGSRLACGAAPEAGRAAFLPRNCRTGEARIWIPIWNRSGRLQSISGMCRLRRWKKPNPHRGRRR